MARVTGASEQPSQLSRGGRTRKEGTQVGQTKSQRPTENQSSKAVAGAPQMSQQTENASRARQGGQRIKPPGTAKPARAQRTPCERDLQTPSEGRCILQKRRPWRVTRSVLHDHQRPRVAQDRAEERPTSARNCDKESENWPEAAREPERRARASESKEKMPTVRVKAEETGMGGEAGADSVAR